MATAGLPEWSPEKAQVDRLVLELHYAFGGGPEDICLVVNTSASGEQVDGVVFKDGLVVVLEFKGWSGRIAASMKSRRWRIRTAAGKMRIVESPVEQASRKRESIARALRHAEPSTDHPKADPMTWPPAWIVVNSAAKATLTGFGDDEAWLDIVPLSEVAGRLKRAHATRPIPSAAWLQLLAALKATPCDWTAWVERKPGVDEARSPQREGGTKVPKLDEWFRGKDLDKVKLAIVMAELLDLRAYLPEILASLSHEDTRIQAAAMHVLFSWEPPAFNARMAEMAEHPDPGLRRPVLEFLSHEPCPEAVNALHRVVMMGPVEDSILALRALGTIGNEAAGRVLVKLLHGRISVLGEPSTFPLATLVTEAGRARAKGSAPLLAEVLRWADSQRSGGNLEVQDLRETVVTAIGMSGDQGDHASTQMLLAKLADRNFDNATALEALGLMGDSYAGREVQKYLDSADEGLVLEAIRALGRMRDRSAFDRLFHSWVRILGTGGATEHRLEDALVSVDPRRLERELPALVERRLREPNLYLLFRAWDRVLSTDSRSTLLRLLEVPEVAGDAAGFLTRLSSPEVVRRASELISSDSGEVRAAAVWLVSRSPDVGDLKERLARMEADPHPSVRVAIISLYSQRPPDEVRRRILPFVRDREENVRHYALVVLAHIALLAQFNARWASEMNEGSGEVLLMAEHLVCGGSNAPEVIPLQGVCRVALAGEIGPGGALFVSCRDGKLPRNLLVLLEADPLDRDRKPWLFPWYDRLTESIFQHRGRRVDLGPRGMRAGERPLVKRLAAKLKTQSRTGGENEEET